MLRCKAREVVTSEAYLRYAATMAREGNTADVHSNPAWRQSEKA